MINTNCFCHDFVISMLQTSSFEKCVQLVNTIIPNMTWGSITPLLKYYQVWGSEGRNDASHLCLIIKSFSPSAATVCCFPWPSPDDAASERTTHRPPAGSHAEPRWSGPLHLDSSPSPEGWRCSCTGRAAPGEAFSASRLLRVSPDRSRFRNSPGQATPAAVPNANHLWQTSWQREQKERPPVVKRKRQLSSSRSFDEGKHGWMEMKRLFWLFSLLSFTVGLRSWLQDLWCWRSSWFPRGFPEELGTGTDPWVTTTDSHR